MNKPKVLIAFRPTPEVTQKQKEVFECIEGERETLTAEEIVNVANAHSVAGILVSVNHDLNRERMLRLPSSVKVIATSSVGFNHLDLKTAKEKGIVITNTPDVLSDCTADLGMTLLLNVARRTREYLRVMEEGWPRNFGQSEMLGVNLKGKTLGILGMGSIGREMAVRARAFGMKIIYCSRRRLSPELELGARYFSEFDAMLPECDFLSLHAPASPETHFILNARTFALMKKGAILINMARGSLVHEDSLISALESGRLFGAGLDVFEKEPGVNPRLLRFPNVFLTPHMGSATQETRTEMGMLATENILRVLRGLPAINPVGI